jgi:hypothetical protein
MILVSVIAAAIGAIALSELLGRGKVVYTRFAGLFAAYILCCGIAGYLAGRAIDALAIALSVVPIMAAWLGFRIHISNSITLEMAGLLEDGKTRTVREIEILYDVDGHAARRAGILKAAGYFSDDAEERLVDTPRSRVILLMIRTLCGPEGPRSVVESLSKMDQRQSTRHEPRGTRH